MHEGTEHTAHQLCSTEPSNILKHWEHRSSKVLPVSVKNYTEKQHSAGCSSVLGHNRDALLQDSLKPEWLGGQQNSHTLSLCVCWWCVTLLSFIFYYLLVSPFIFVNEAEQRQEMCFNFQFAKVLVSEEIWRRTRCSDLEGDNMTPTNLTVPQFMQIACSM